MKINPEKVSVFGKGFLFLQEDFKNFEEIFTPVPKKNIGPMMQKIMRKANPANYSERLTKKTSWSISKQ